MKESKRFSISLPMGIWNSRRQEGRGDVGEFIDYKDGGLLEEVAFVPLDGLLGMVNAMPVRCL